MALLNILSPRRPATPAISQSDTGVQKTGRGLKQTAPTASAGKGSCDAREEFALMRRLVEASGRPLSFSLVQAGIAPESWRVYLDCLAGMQPEAAPITGRFFRAPSVYCTGSIYRSIRLVLIPATRAIAQLPPHERVAAMRDPSMRQRLLSEDAEGSNPFHHIIVGALPGLFPLGDPPVYDPKPENARAAQAAAQGIPIKELAYDLLLEQDGQALLYWPSKNFLDGDLKRAREMLTHPNTVIGLCDGGAHYGMVCDSSFPTYLLAHCTRDLAGADGISLPCAIAELTRRCALNVCMPDRGLIAAGMKADISVIDYGKRHLHVPGPVYDSPAGDRRLTRSADGYVATLVDGQVTYRNEETTGTLPGRLVRHRDAAGAIH